MKTPEIPGGTTYFCPRLYSEFTNNVPPTPPAIRPLKVGSRWNRPRGGCMHSLMQVPVKSAVFGRFCFAHAYRGRCETYRQRNINPRTAGGLSHLRTAGGADDRPPPQRTRKLRKIATSGERRWIGRGKFYKKYSDNFLIRSNLRSQGVKKGQIFSKSGNFRRKSQLSQ